MARITGILKNGMGKPITHCEIALKALRTSASVIVHTVASQSPGEAGLYDMAAEPGQYRVTLCVDGYPPEYVGDIQIYHDSPDGTLNYFLGLPQDGDLRPDVMKEFEVMVAKVSAQSAEVEKNRDATAESARAALDSQNAAHASESAVAASASAALASQSAAKASELAAASGAQSAQSSQQAAKASESAAADSAAAALASQNAAKESERAAASSAQAAQASQQAAHGSESAVVDSAAAALASQNAAKASELAAASSAETAATDAAVKAAQATEATLREAVRADADRAASSATEAHSFAEQAAGSASGAHNSQTAAAQSASQAAGSSSAATGSASAAKASETAAAGSASSAAQSVSQVSSSASAAAGSASAAKASETAAAGSASAAAGSAQSAKTEVDRISGGLDTKQDKSELLGAIAALQAAANKIVVLTGPSSVEAADLSTFAKSLLSKTDQDSAIEYLGLKETVTLAGNAWSKKYIGRLNNGGAFAGCNQGGIYEVSIGTPSSVADFPMKNGTYIYGYGVLYVTSNSGTISQLYISHNGHIAARIKWGDQPNFKSWAVYDPNSSFEYGCPLIGSLIPWALERMPQEIWPNCGMHFIPYMGQSFDPELFPKLHDVYPDNRLPTDMRGYTARGWDNGRGIDIGRALLSYQDDAIQNITGQFGWMPFNGSSPVASGAFSVDKIGANVWGGGTERRDCAIGFNASNVVRTAEQTRVKSVAWNYITRAK
ncbi:prophage tail fiber N-terminal domain-containing protein [Edwardsiella piscicida]|nr:prophage tail fiber N-terminal domain-containing protein [Edwardsiella piscicida]ELM3729182.1 prophage tail fiber N-terminal domain-containing protein [Edwardsiella piscicida]ELV7536211.1 prophage tail fiber N-terminal domain-containing protein [Edwardsiella piscicida]